MPPPESLNNLSGYGRYVAYGNAKNTSDGLVCQHGAEECTENRVLLCASDSSPNWFAALLPCLLLPIVVGVSLHLLILDRLARFPFALCLSQNHSPEAVKVCADAAKLDYAAIKICTEGALGLGLCWTAGCCTCAPARALRFKPCRLLLHFAARHQKAGWQA